MSGKIEILLGGRLRALRFNNYQKEALGKLYGKDPLECQKIIAKKWGDSVLRMGVDLVYTGLIGDYDAKLKDREFTREDVAEWVGDASDEDIAAVITTWAEANNIRELIKQQNPPAPSDEGTGKKKVSAKK